MKKAKEATMEQKYWPDEDARTLARHHEIRSDPKRHADAIKAAQKMADDKAVEAASMKKVAGDHPHQGGKGQHSKGGMVILDSNVRKV